MAGDGKCRRSSIFKMLTDVRDSRKIYKLPAPYSKHLSPYLSSDFTVATRKACEENKTVTDVLKISKVIILGDVCVGKTCLVNRFCHQVFDSQYKATIGVDFEVEKFEVLLTPFNVQIWDTAGQERFKSIAQSYYRSAHAVILVFDVTNISTLAHCKSWMKEALDASSSEPLKFLVATKKDLISQASYEVVEGFAKKVAITLEAEYWPVSSKTGENIDKVFTRIAALLFDRLLTKESEASLAKSMVGIDVVSLKNKKKKEQCKLSSCGNKKCN